MPSPKQVQVQVVHRLSSIVSRVHNDAITIVQLLFTRNLSRRGHQMTHQRRIFRQRLRSRPDMLFGNDQQMRGSLRIDIGKANAEFVFIHAAGWNSTVDDFAEKAVRRRRGVQLCFHGRKYFGCCPAIQGL